MAFSAAHYAFGDREFGLIASLCVSSSWAFKSNDQSVIPEICISLMWSPIGQFHGAHSFVSDSQFAVSMFIPSTCDVQLKEHIWYIYNKVPGTDSACPGFVSVYFTVSVFLCYQCERYEIQVLLELWNSAVTSSILCLHKTWWDAEPCQGNAWDEVLSWAWGGHAEAGQEESPREGRRKDTL